jgi:hypothetical protein
MVTVTNTHSKRLRVAEWLWVGWDPSPVATTTTTNHLDTAFSLGSVFFLKVTQPLLSTEFY